MNVKKTVVANVIVAATRVLAATRLTVVVVERWTAQSRQKRGFGGSDGTK